MNAESFLVESVLRYLHNFLSNLYTSYQNTQCPKTIFHLALHLTSFLNALLVHLQQPADPSKLKVVRRFATFKNGG